MNDKPRLLKELARGGEPRAEQAPGRRKIRVLAWPGLGARDTNAYTWALYRWIENGGDASVVEFSVGRVLRGRFDVLHMHWPEHVLARRSAIGAAARVTALWLLLVYARICGKKLVWTAHNLRQHERLHPRIEKVFWWVLHSSVHGLFCLSRVGLSLLHESYPRLCDVPAFITPHGHYRAVYGMPIGREEARRRLRVPLEARVITYVGAIRPYKNVDHLISVFRSLNDPDARLIVAGCTMNQEEESKLRQLALGDERIVLVLRLLSDDELKTVVEACDIVALPFTAILNSGSTLLGLSLNRPVLVPRLGALVELQEDVGSEWVRTYEGTLSVGTLGTALSWAARRSAHDVPNLERYDWAQIARHTVDGYRAIQETSGEAASYNGCKGRLNPTADELS